MFDRLIEMLKANPRKIVFTEGHDARILGAQRFHLAFPPRHLPCVGGYPHAAAG